MYRSWEKTRPRRIGLHFVDKFHVFNKPTSQSDHGSLVEALHSRDGDGHFGA